MIIFIFLIAILHYYAFIFTFKKVLGITKNEYDFIMVEHLLIRIYIVRVFDLNRMPIVDILLLTLVLGYVLHYFRNKYNKMAVLTI